MTLNSLRLRLLVAGIATILAALTLAGLALAYLFERHIARSVAQDVEVHLRQLLAGIDIDAQGHLVIVRPPADPRFADPLSGLYWQVGDDQKDLLRSRSLWDTTLSLPADQPASGEVHWHETAGPSDARLLVAERRLSLTGGGRIIPARAAVAVDLKRVSAARRDFVADLVWALGLLAAVLATATALQVALGLRPLALLREGIADIRKGRRRLLAADVPDEVRPLVDEMNALLDARDRDVLRSRDRAADLAHGLKTPLAALASDGRRLRERGEDAIAAEIEGAIESMRRHVDRELTRARIRGSGRAATESSTAVRPLVEALVATLARTPAGESIRYDVAIDEGAQAPFDRTDLAEVLGNLLENATRHAASRVSVGARGGGAAHRMELVIDDDGPGIAPEHRAMALARGGSLDRQGEGAGLGLAIVQDVLDAYGFELALDQSPWGGLRAVIRECQTARTLVS